MAFIDKRRGRKGDLSQRRDSNSGKQKQIPRKLTKHLDRATPEEAQVWLDEWERAHGKASDRAQRVILAPDDRLSIYPLVALSI